MKPQSPQRNPLCAPKESPPYPPLSPCVEAVSQGRKRAVIPAKLVPAKAGSGNPGYLKEARLPESTRYFSLKGPAGMPALHHPRYRARLRGHDELRPSLVGERDGRRGKSLGWL